MNPFSWSVCVVVYSNVTFYFSYALCNLDWCSPALSQLSYLTGVPRAVIFSKTLLKFSDVEILFSLGNSMNKGCNRLLRQSSTDFQLDFPGMEQSCPQKYFLPAVAILYTSYFSPHVLLSWNVHNHSKPGVCLLTWHRESYMLCATTFLPDVSTYLPRWCPYHSIGPTSYAILLFVTCLHFIFWRIGKCLLSFRGISLCLQVKHHTLVLNFPCV